MIYNPICFYYKAYFLLGVAELYILSVFVELFGSDIANTGTTLSLIQSVCVYFRRLSCAYWHHVCRGLVLGIDYKASLLFTHTL